MPAERRCPSCQRVFGGDVLFCPTDGAPLVRPSVTRTEDGADPYIGLSILGQIEIKKLAGVGSMARVYRAFQLGVERDVAVKILHRELSANTEVVARFHREAKIASRLSHTNVVSVLFTAQLPDTTPDVGGELVIVMEYLDGMSLLSALGASGGALPLPRALHIILQTCDAVGEAHAMSMVHRDLKPENVMLVRRGDDPDFVKVLDFGLARLNAHEASYATRAGAIFGSPRYISPEGAQGLPVGPPADVYGIATMLYQCLAGRTPFEAETPVGFLLAHASEKPPRVTEHARAAYVPAPIADLLDQSLAKRPEDRPPDARTFGKMLMDAARRSGLVGDAVVGYAGWRAQSGSGGLLSLARTRAMSLSPSPTQAETPPAVEPTTTTSGTQILEPVRVGTSVLEPKASGTLIAAADDLPYPDATPPVAPTLFDAPIAVSRTSFDPPPPVIEPTRPSTPSISTMAPSTPARGPLAEAFPSDPPPSVSYAPPPVHPGTMPGASLPTRIPDDAPQRARSAWTTMLLVAACFACGAALAAVGASRLGVVGGRASISRADALLAEAGDAAIRKEWDAPPLRSVKDLLARGRREFPGDVRFPEAQRKASVDVMMVAVQERAAGHPDEARHLAEVARSIDDTNSLADTMLRELVPDGRTAYAPPPPPPPSTSTAPGRTATHARVPPPPPSPPAPGVPSPPKPPDSAAPAAPDGGRWL